MTTYYVSSIDPNTKTLYKGTSLNKAKKVCDECSEPCKVHHFTGYNIPLPIDHWNEAFEKYVAERGRTTCFVGMTKW